MQCLQQYLQAAMRTASEIYSASRINGDAVEANDNESGEPRLVSYADDV